jgi:hypothetical protein
MGGDDPEKQVRSAVEELLRVAQTGEGPPIVVMVDTMLQTVVRLRAEAVAEEREGCAKTVEAGLLTALPATDPWNEALRHAAQFIRRRGAR